MVHDEQIGDPVAFDIFNKIARAEWDTLLFFYGVVLCVGGLGFIGYLALASEVMYTDWGAALELNSTMLATPANVMVGVLSAIVDNIPVMFAVLTMMPDMSMGQWLLVTLTAGVGRLHAVHRFRRRRGADGSGPRSVHLFRPSQVGSGHRPGVCGQYPDPRLDQCRQFLMPQNRIIPTPAKEPIKSF